MSELSSTPAENTAATNNRLWNLVIVSLVLNGLILIILFTGFLIHRQRSLQLGDRGDRFQMMNQRGFDRHFYKFVMGPRWGWSRPEGFQGREPVEEGPNMMPGRMMGNGQPISPAERSDKILNDLSNSLSLTDDQKTKLRPVIEAQVAEMQKDREAQRQARQKLMEDTKAKIKPILNADQQKQLDQIRLPGPAMPPPPPDETHP